MTQERISPEVQALNKILEAHALYTQPIPEGVITVTHERYGFSMSVAWRNESEFFNVPEQIRRDIEAQKQREQSSGGFDPYGF